MRDADRPPALLRTVKQAACVEQAATVCVAGLFSLLHGCGILQRRDRLVRTTVTFKSYNWFPGHSRFASCQSCQGTVLYVVFVHSKAVRQHLSCSHKLWA